MYPVKFQTQTDFRGRALGDSLMDEVRDVNLHIIHGLASISVEMSRHLGLLRIMCYLVEVPLEPLFQTVLVWPTYCFLHLVHIMLYTRLLLLQLVIFLARD